MFGINDYFKGYRYTTSTVIKYDDFEKLKKLAKRENRRFKKQRRVERLVVYPVPGTIRGVGQLCILR